MWKGIKQLTLKQQILCFLEFIISYISPLIAILLFFFMRVKRKAKVYQLTPICGAVIAMFFYLIDYAQYTMMA